MSGLTEALFSGFEHEPIEEPPPFVASERTMLDLIHTRYTTTRPGNGPRYVVAEHVQNHAGFAVKGRSRRADALVLDLWESTNNAITGIEVKVSRSDWLTELKDPEKANAFMPYCDFWYLAVSDPKIVRDDLPLGWGLLVPSKTPWGEMTLRISKRAKKRDRLPMPLTMTAAWMRAAVKTSTRLRDRADSVETGAGT